MKYPSERKPFSLPEKAVLSIRESRSFYERKPFFLHPLFHSASDETSIMAK